MKERFCTHEPAGVHLWHPFSDLRHRSFGHTTPCMRHWRRSYCESDLPQQDSASPPVSKICPAFDFHENEKTKIDKLSKKYYSQLAQMNMTIEERKTEFVDISGSTKR